MTWLFRQGLAVDLRQEISDTNKQLNQMKEDSADNTQVWNQSSFIKVWNFCVFYYYFFVIFGFFDPDINGLENTNLKSHQQKFCFFFGSSYVKDVNVFQRLRDSIQNLDNKTRTTISDLGSRTEVNNQVSQILLIADTLFCFSYFLTLFG